MRVEIDSSEIDSYMNIAKEVNYKASRFSQSKYMPKKEARSNIFGKDISVYSKKALLAEKLHSHIIAALSINFSKVSSKAKVLASLRGNLVTLRLIVRKLRDINFYLEEHFLADIGQKRKSADIYKINNAERLIEKTRFSLSRKYIDKLEHVTYKLIEKIIIFDKRLLENYRAKEEKVVSDEIAEAGSLYGILKRESELLSHMEAKLPPPGMATSKLLGREIFVHWAARVMALLASFESEMLKEHGISKQLKKDLKIKSMMARKIRSLENEKSKLIELKEKRLINSVNIPDGNLRLMFHELIAIKKL